MCELKAAFQEHLGQVPQTQLVAHAPEDHQENDISRELKIIEGGATSFIEGVLAGVAAEGAIAEVGLFGPFAG
jgi:hypothetical protein